MSIALPELEIFVSPAGSPYGDGSPGYPVRDLGTAVALLRRVRSPCVPAIVWIAPGRYPMTSAVELGPSDSFTTFAALDASRPPVFDGGVHLTSWAETEVDGRTVWAAAAPSDAPVGRSFFVDGRRCPRPRWPREGYLRIAEQPGLDLSADMVSTLFDGTSQFRYEPGDLPALSDPTAVEVVIPHYWIQERMPVTRIDEQFVHSELRSIFSLRDDAARRFARYYLENVREAFGSVPGEWYHDRVDGRILYVPLPSDSLTSFTATVPVLPCFVRARSVRSVRFEGLVFRHADWSRAPGSRAPFGHREDPLLPADVEFAAAPQAAADVGAALSFEEARGCSVVGCVVEHVGGHAIDLGPGCRHNLLSGNQLSDLGAGGVKMGGSAVSSDDGFTCQNEVSDNEIVAGGRVYPQCVAVLVRHAADNVLAHNHIHDFFYTGISCGWVWGYDASPSSGNQIVGNHIHNLGQGLLNDMGGVYLLGVAPGTVVRGNLIHDVSCANYGGWGIYLDEGSSHVVVEGNVCHDLSSQCFHQHYGRENIVRHNVFAYGRQGAVAVTRPEPHVGFTFERNIVLCEEGVPAFSGVPGKGDVRAYGLVSDLNVFWSSAGGVAVAGNGRKDAEMRWSVVELLSEEWRTLGRDRHSVVADPLFASVAERDFSLPNDSPAFEVGFVAPDLSSVGPRPGTDRPHPLARGVQSLGVRPSTTAVR